jgi:hypothetical protein
MTIRERIITYLQAHPEGVDDDTLAEALQLRQRQQANSRCRQLAREGRIARRRVGGKIHNFWLGSAQALPVQAAPSHAVPSARAERAQPWFWEGNIQAAVVRHLAMQGCAIRSVADTANRQHGKDIAAERDGRPLWITVKGYPRGTEKTSPTTQAGHWFKQAVFDVIEYRGESQTVELGLALPDFPRYRALAQRIAWFQPVARFVYYWVRESGEVSVE